MKKKNFRHFVCGFLFGAFGLYWYSVYGEQSLNYVLDWMQYEADRYKEEHGAPTADSGWRHEKR
jgi:hypothetical protein